MVDIYCIAFPKSIVTSDLCVWLFGAVAEDPSDLSGDRDPFATKKKTFSDDDLLPGLLQCGEYLRMVEGH